MAYTSKQSARNNQAAEESAVKQATAQQTAPAFSDQRASTSVQLKQQQMMNASDTHPLQRAEDEELLQGKFESAQLMEEEEPLQGKFAAAQLMEEEEPLQGKFATAQLMEEEEPLQGKFETAQLAEEEELLQGKFSSPTTAQLEEKPNNTGLPNQLKSGIESLSGMSLDGVKVHYNSDKPAQLNAHAYAQGTDIHVAPGQEQHLPHEAWHVVQQAQGRVKPTMQMKAGVPVNDDVGLETEADVMGAKAMQQVPVQVKQVNQTLAMQSSVQLKGVIQAQKKTVGGVEVDVGGGYTNWDGWHINWVLGSKKKGFEQYHLTSQDRTQHYFFIINGDDLEDTKPPQEFVPKKKKGHVIGGLSIAPAGVQTFVRTYISQLMG
jgi:hypothetical protein